MPFYLAIDAGGTKTDYLLADEHRELARIRGGCIKRMRVDAATASANLESSLRQLEERAGRNLAGVHRTCVGTAGETVPLVTEWLRAAIPQHVGGELLIVGDVEIALSAAFGAGPGVLVLAGTGSNVAGRLADGTLVTAGGWGPLMADQGSANRIGLNALRAGFLAGDEGRSTVLLHEAMRFWSLRSVSDLIEYANGSPAPDFASFAETVHQCALASDQVATEVIQREGRELGYLARLVLRRIAEKPGVPENERLLRVAFAGSVAEKVQLLREALLKEIRWEFPSIHAGDGVVDPLAGALWRARDFPA